MDWEQAELSTKDESRDCPHKFDYRGIHRVAQNAGTMADRHEWGTQVLGCLDCPASRAIMGSMAPSDDDVTSSDPAGRRVPTDDAVAERLATLVTTLRSHYGVPAVTKEPLHGVAGVTTRLNPPSIGSCNATWIEMSDSELILNVGIVGRWEMNRDLVAVKQIEETVDAVVSGRVVRLFGWGRTTVIVTLADGRSETATRYDGLPIPLPGWRRMARRLVYVPWEAPESA